VPTSGALPVIATVTARALRHMPVARSQVLAVWQGSLAGQLIIAQRSATQTPAAQYVPAAQALPQRPQ
jgi:hypothetical protein